jgi:microcystin-dependent protein
MSDPFVAEIRIFAGNFAPRGWALCNGQLLPISQNTALFSLLGTNYGGDGRSTFGLPNLQGAAPMHQGQSPGGSMYFLGQMGGEQTVTLISTEMPMHTHSVSASGTDGGDRSPANERFAVGVGGINSYAAQGASAQLAPQTMTVSGGSLPHNNMMPYLTMTFIIALQGIFPPRS